MEPVTVVFGLLKLGLSTAQATGLLRNGAARQLDGISKQVSSLIAVPLLEALGRLEQAALVQSPEQRRLLLEEARAKASDVVARDTAPAGVRVHGAVVLAACWWSLQHPELAQAAAATALHLQEEAVLEVKTQQEKEDAASQVAAWGAESTRARSVARVVSLLSAIPGASEILWITYHERKCKQLRQQLLELEGLTPVLFELAAQVAQPGPSLSNLR